jgi:hypothetical protein
MPWNSAASSTMRPELLKRLQALETARGLARAGSVGGAVERDPDSECAEEASVRSGRSGGVPVTPRSLDEAAWEQITAPEHARLVARAGAYLASASDPTASAPCGRP